MSDLRCKSCQSDAIEVDSSRGDAICTACGVVLEDQSIVSDIEFRKQSSGQMVVGQHVEAGSTGRATNTFGNSYHLNDRSSKEKTLKKAEKDIDRLCQQLRIPNRKVFVATALNFFKLASNRGLTKGRKQIFSLAACVYIACRTNRVSILLFDISDMLQLDVDELGRTYLKISNKLFIRLPTLDPWIYVRRLASKLEFGDMHNTVCTTAHRIIQRMAKDNINTGRKPSGICGAALLIAARLHGFNRTFGDIVKIVHTHRRTLRRRMLEFGDTPSSGLTLDEFMTVDLETEQDPPSFIAARKKDRERLENVDNLGQQMNDLQKKINRQLEKKKMTNRKKKAVDSGTEASDTARFIHKDTLKVVRRFIQDNPDDPTYKSKEPIELGPDIASMNLPVTMDEECSTIDSTEELEDGDGVFDATGLDDEELDKYILTDCEVKEKSCLWEKVNETYLKEQREKEEQRLKDLEIDNPEKKPRKSRAKKIQVPAKSAAEAIKKMLVQKNLSNKINYDVLKGLTADPALKE